MAHKELTNYVKEEPLTPNLSLPNAPDPGAWDGFLEWASRLLHREQFRSDELEFKLELADRLREARQATRSGGPTWYEAVKKTFDPPYNLTNWRVQSPFFSGWQLIGTTA